MRFNHILTKTEMKGRAPCFITLCDNTGHRTTYYGIQFADITKFKVFIEGTELSFDAERRYDYKNKLQMNRLYSVNFYPFINFGLNAGSMIEIYTKDDEDFLYMGDRDEDPEAYDAAIDEYINENGYPIYVVFPFEVINRILGIKEKTSEEILKQIKMHLSLDHTEREIEEIIEISKKLSKVPEDGWDSPFFK